MTGNDGHRARDGRYGAWIGGTLALFLVAGAVGFVWLPSSQPGAAALDLWTVICRAVGLPTRDTKASPPDVAPPASGIAWTTSTRELLVRGDAPRGAAVAATCSGCHGATGISADAAFPNLAGQSVAALYKQLEDFKGGKRNAAVMGVFVAPLSSQQLLDVATYYASLPRVAVMSDHPAESPHRAAHELVEAGSPMRGIAPCAACHGPQGTTMGAPDLRGQQRAYLEEQLQAFKSGGRRNDIGEQMRSVARALSADEIAMLAAHYSSLARSSR